MFSSEGSFPLSPPCVSMASLPKGWPLTSWTGGGSAMSLPRLYIAMTRSYGRSHVIVEASIQSISAKMATG